MEKIKVGVVGVGRGTAMIGYCNKAGNAELISICDKWEKGLMRAKNDIGNDAITYYTDYDEFLKENVGKIDVVVLANYANEHAPFAIKAMEMGYNVISEVLPCQTMKEAVELVECIERTGKIYMYGENYCYMPGPSEIKKLYNDGAIGEIEYAEGEYVHNCESIWPQIAYGDKDHWRNNMYATFYCTHSLGPMIHVTGLRPVKVTGFELKRNAAKERMGSKSGTAGIEMVTLENGAILKSLHGGLNQGNVWYSFYGTKGRLETAREAIRQGDVSMLYANLLEKEGDYDRVIEKSYRPENEHTEAAKGFGHGGSDYFMMWNCMEYLLGNQKADVIDIFEALDMFLPGMFAYRSALAGGISMDVPNLRNKDEREKWRNDTTCTDPKVAGDMLIPAYSKGFVEVPDEVYEEQKRLWNLRGDRMATAVKVK